MRRDKINYYLDLAEMVSQRCTCLRKHYGAVIVKNDEVISTGYAGAPRGRKIAQISICVSVKIKNPKRRTLRIMPQCTRRSQRDHQRLPR